VTDLPAGAACSTTTRVGRRTRIAPTLASFALLGATALLAARRAPAPRAPTHATQLEAASPGQRIFEQRCALCHSTGERGGQGPGLGGVVGRAAASSSFGYTRALRDSGLTWDRTTLDRFLTAPAQLVPGTTMPMPLPDAAERSAVVAYLATLGLDDASGAERAAWNDAMPLPAPPGLRVGRDALTDYRGDGPGVSRRLTLADLPPPFATSSAHNAPDVVEPPPGAHPYVPLGFRVDVFAHDLTAPRVLRVSPSGDLFVVESQAGRIRVLRASAGARSAANDTVFASGLDEPFGVAFYPPGARPEWVYVAETNAVVRFPYRSGDATVRGAPETVVRRLTQEAGGHWTRDIAFTLDGSRMLVSVGSASNVAEGGVNEQDRADVLSFDPQGGDRRVFASGLRNCVGLSVHPVTGDVWCATNERDGLGDDLVPDYVTRVRPGGFYGWPWFYLGDHEDPRHAGERPDLAGHVLLPDVLVQSHSAALQIAFYTARALPAKYRGGALVTLHGSWNRGKRTGPKVVLVPLEGGAPTGEYEDFMTGFVVNDAAVWARPVGVAVAPDGSLFVGEDANGIVWRVEYVGE
jgi:glucose/arabinose dehydrogenase/cytochrome c2